MEKITFSSLGINNMPILKSYIKSEEISDLSFTCMYEWAHKFRMRFAVINNYICIVSYFKNEVVLYPPMGEYGESKFEDVIRILYNLFSENNSRLKFKYVPEKYICRFEKLKEYTTSISFNIEESDYVYDACKFLDLKGNKNRDKRCQVNHFLKNNIWRYETIVKNNKNDCMEIMKRWCREYDCSKCEYGCEYEALERVIDNYEMLDCRGGIVYIENEPKGFAIGSALNENTVVSHFQKGDKHIKGLYAYINILFYEKEFPNVKYINLEEDAGVQGLKEWKQSRKPEAMIHKYEIIIERI